MTARRSPRATTGWHGETMTKLTNQQVRRGLADLMDDHGFGGGPLWWNRYGPNDEEQAVRTVVWGLGKKPNPHLMVEVIADNARAELARRATMTEQELSEVMHVHYIPLTQSWEQARDAFETNVLPFLDGEIVVESESGDTLVFDSEADAQEHALSNDTDD